MAKYVQPNFIVDSSAQFLRNVSFDSSVYLHGATHVDTLLTTSNVNPFVLLTEGNTAGSLIKTTQIGSAAFMSKDAIDASIARIDASINRLDASLNDTIDITEILDASLATKVNRAGDTMTGLLTFAAQGFGLDSVTITTVDTSAEGLGSLDTAIATSGAIRKYVDSKISDGVQAWNGLSESVDGSIGLGGTLNQTTSIIGYQILNLGTSGDSLSELNITATEVSINSSTSIGINSGTNLELYGGSGINIASGNSVDIISANEFNVIASSNISLYAPSNMQLESDGPFDISAAAPITIQSSGGDINLISDSLINIESSDSIILNSATTGVTLDSSGLVYSADYSSVYTDRSLVDKAFVLSSINSSTFILTDGEGTTANGTSVDLGGTLTSDANINTGVNKLFVTGELNVVGDLTVTGTTTTVNSVNLNVSDNIITINSGETGSGVSKGYGGLLIDRGTADPYVFVFEESTDTFRVGIATEAGLPVGTQAVATRQDAPVINGIGYWNNTLSRIDTSAGFNFTPGVGLGLPIATADATATNALMLVGGLVKSRTLGDMAFSNVTDFYTKTEVNNLFAASDASIDALQAYDIVIDASIDAIEVILDGKLDAVASTTGIVGGHDIYSNENNNIAYIKKIVAGTGASIISDASTITISVSGAAGYVSKYAGTFNGTSGTTLTITAATHTLGVGPLQVVVYDGLEQVYTDVVCAANGDITLNWSSGSLSATCKYVIMG